MKVSVFGIIAIVLLVAAAVFGYFGGTSTTDTIAVATAFAGAGAIFISKWKTVQANWKAKTSMIVAAAGGLAIALGAMAESLITTIIVGVAGALALVIGLVAAKKNGD